MTYDINPVLSFASGEGIKFEKDFPLSSVSSFKTGGKAAVALFPSDARELASLVRFLKSAGIRHDIFGNTTNVLFSDDGYSGAVIFTKSLSGITRNEEGEVYAGAGESLNRLCRYFAKNGMTGAEALYGIPGSVGGAVFMNAGAYEHEIGEIISSVDIYDCDSDCFMTLGAREMDFSYRHSACQGKSWIVTGASFRLGEGKRDEIEAKMESYIAARKEKQPLEYPSAGSVFKRYPGRYTAKMIDECGLKGCKIGGAEVSEKHAGFIINKDKATSSEILSLIELVKEKVKEKFGIDIECEIRIISAE